ncbi:MAG: hypothetical protein KF729_07110 [Sandaracinaceae bacterium]|nr:hypothetical protein [Sandaracinaceae bacterium]
MSVAWVLNLDAEVELGGGRLGAAAARRMEAVRRALALPAGHVVLDVDADAGARGLPGRAWCPTPSALARLARAGALVPEAPPIEVVRRVNARGFAHDLVALPGTVACDDLDAVRAAASRPGRWLLFRAFTFAGRGQRRVDAGAWDAGAEAWARSALAAGPVYVLPRVAIELECALHGALAPDGSLRVGRPTVAEVDAAGQWQRSRLAGDDLGESEQAALRRAFERVAESLHGAGYFGPFGIDAFRHAEGFHPLSEINARYSMGWPVGMGGWA